MTRSFVIYMPICDTNTVYTHIQNSMIFFAAGNSGQNGDRTVTTQSTGKNSVSVGSSETTYGGPNITYVAFYSSKGPTYDGR